MHTGREKLLNFRGRDKHNNNELTHMNFEFSEEQLMLRDQSRGFLAEHCPTSVVRTVLDGEAEYDATLWQRVANMGWTATVIPEAYGGLGLSYYELAIIAEELGRSVAPIPFASSVYLATEALLAFGSEAQKLRWLPKLASGEVIGTVAFTESAGRLDASNVGTHFSNGVLNGCKLPVADGGIADIAIVLASDNDGVSLYLVELADACVHREAVRTVDPSRGLASLSFEGATAELLGEFGAGLAAVEQLHDRAAVLFAWEQVGLADAALEQAKHYALDRFAFGRPIGSYQAIKHKLVNVYVKNTLARSNCYYGAWALEANGHELKQAAATARVAAIQAATFAAEENIQTHGGMGFTWEFDCQFYYRRAKLLSLVIGSEAYWQNRLVDALAADHRASA